jgi:predicted lysophospholipase L1 biosynthesis ABC-type transport system permease subunit
MMRRRLAAVGILAAALVAGAAVTVGFALSTGFDRAARAAGLPDVIARFDPEDRGEVDARVRGLPNLQARSYRFEVTRVGLSAPRGATSRGALSVVLGGRRGYDVVAGRDLSRRPGEVVVERGVARALHLAVGDPLRVGRRLGVLRVVGIATSPDNVAYPLARVARVYVGVDEVRAAFPGERVDLPANVALLWVNDRTRTAITLAQARTVAFGLGDLRFITRTGVRLVLAQAAGIVIALLSAFALVALVAAGTMLATGAHAEVQRRLPSLGVRRALGYTPAQVVAGHARAALLVAAPAAAAGLALGALAVSGPAGELLEALNERPPGGALLPPLALTWIAVCAVVVTAATVPAWLAARRPIAPLLGGGELAGRRPVRTAGGGGLAATGARFAVAARGRWAGSVLTLGVCAGIVLLMLALASLLVRLRDDPAVLGKRYELTVDAPPSLLASIRAVPGVAAATERFQVDAADAFRLGQPLRLVAYRGDHTAFEAPPLASGRRLRGAGEVEVGQGLADALGLRPGSPLATLSPSGRELRLRVVGVVRALDNSGRIGWVSAGTLERVEPGASGRIVIRLAAGADRDAVLAGLRRLDVEPVRVASATTRDTGFLGILAGVLRAVALAVGLVCLYALLQGLAMTARERRGALAVLRACGAGRGDVAALLAGAAAAVAVPAAVLAAALELAVLGPLVTRLAAGYAGLPLAPTGWQVALVAGGLVLLALAAAALVARRLVREPVVRGLREELP